MGTQEVQDELDAGRIRQFTRKLLADVRALEKMIEGGCLESGVRRIGAEQEVFLARPDWRPAPVAMAVLARLADDPHFTTELATFNLEFNLDPVVWGRGCLSQLEGQLDSLLARLRAAAEEEDARVVLIGILPTLSKSDLSLDNMTPRPRYMALNEALTRMRGSEYSFMIKGAQELRLTHDSVMLEACNTSFQVHFQVAPQEFAHLYNIAQAVAAPVLAAAANSPLLFGKRLWRETRIALFQQSIDTRPQVAHVREQSPRVHFGRSWVDSSVLEILHEDISRFRVLLAAEVEEDPFEVLASGRAPQLSALRLHNGTVYRWNRPCYGISDGKPHLRIENRVLPAGPTVKDEIANAAFWFGLMNALAEEFEDIRKVMSFEEVKENFVSAARHGLKAQFHWMDRRSVPAQDLICEDLLPLARAGLHAGGVGAADADRFLDIVEERVSTGRTGAQWQVDSCRELGGRGTPAERMAALVAGTVSRQSEGEPVHLWSPARLEEAGGWQQHYLKVEQLMSTDLFTVNEHELVDLVACMMDWEHIRHVPVEDNEHRIVGLVTSSNLLRLVARGLTEGETRSIPVAEVMERDLVTVAPETSTLEAIELMRVHRVSCLPVVRDGRLVGIVTERDFFLVAGQLLEEVLRRKAGSDPAANERAGQSIQSR